MKTIFSMVITIVIVSFTNSCGNPDPCESVTCFHGGTCLDGTCDCPSGFYGKDCRFYKISGGWTAWDTGTAHYDYGNCGGIHDSIIRESYYETIVTNASASGVTISNFRNLGLIVDATVYGFSITIPQQFICTYGDCDEYVFPPWGSNGSQGVLISACSGTISDNYNTIRFSYSDSGNYMLGGHWYIKGYVTMKR